MAHSPMASIGHVAVGLAVARGCAPQGPRGHLVRAALAGLALLPDADVIAFAFGIPYGAEWGHRGATHSLVFALAVSAPFALSGRVVGITYPRALVCAFLAIASHGALDAMTTVGLGAALLWPFDSARIFLPWRPIPVAPIGLGIVSPRGLLLMFHEALMFTPFWVVALWPRRRSAPST